MSTKIYDAYKTHLNLYELLERFKLLIPKFEELKARGYAKLLVQRTIREYDVLIKNGRTDVDINELLESIMNQDEDTLKKTPDNEYSSINYSMSCSLFPLSKKTTLIKLWVERKELREYFESLEYIEDYHYQNSTDPPKEISNKDWKKREKDWDKTWGDDAAYKSSYMFTFINKNIDITRFFHFKKYNINFNDYIDDEIRAKDLLRTDWIVNKSNELRKANTKSDDIGHPYSTARYLYMDYMETPEFKVELEEYKRKLQKINFK